MKNNIIIRLEDNLFATSHISRHLSAAKDKERYLSSALPKCKLKTAFTMVTQVVILLWLTLMEFDIFSGSAVISWSIFALVWISVALTVISGAVYLKGYWKYIDMK